MSNRVRVQQLPHGLYNVSIPRALAQALRIEKGDVIDPSCSCESKGRARPKGQRRRKAISYQASALSRSTQPRGVQGLGLMADG